MVEIRKTGQKIAENFHTEAVITGIDLYTQSADKEAEMANLIVNESIWEWVTAKKKEEAIPAREIFLPQF